MKIKVKPLVWEWDKLIELWVAKSMGVNLYHVTSDGEWRRAERLGYPMEQAASFTDGLEAVQADHDARILSAIEVEE